MNQIFKWVVIATFIILISLSILLPWLLINDIENTFQIVASLLGTVASMGTLLIAFLLYDKFGVTQKIVVHQISLIERILRNLKSLALEVQDSSSVNIQYVRQDLSTTHLKKKGFIVNFDNYVNSFKEITEIEKDIYFPKELLPKVYAIHFNQISGPVNNDNGRYYILIFIRPQYSTEDKPMVWGLVNEGKTDIIEYFQNINSLIEACTKWIKKHSTNKFEINI